MVLEFAGIAEKNEILVAEARYAPNPQLLSLPFRSELIHSAA